MNITDDLRKLADLHAAGQLTDREFADAKQRAMLESRPAWPSPSASNRAFAEPAVSITAKTYRSSRWSAGNFFFPDRLTLADDGITFCKGAMFGSTEEHISYRAVASFRTKNGIFLSNVCIESSGGSQPIYINGLWKSEAKKVQDTIRAFQGAG
jgi:hypothetical protein